MAALLVSALGQAPAAATAGGSVAELSRLEDVWNEAHLRSDVAALDQLWADDIVVIVPRMPPFTKSDALAVFRSGRMKFERYATSDVKVRLYEGCAVVTGRLRRARNLSGRLLDDDWRFTKVYVRQPTAWRVVAFQASESGE
jgi:ketosteroid isomerase-like protein